MILLVICLVICLVKLILILTLPVKELYVCSDKISLSPGDEKLEDTRRQWTGTLVAMKIDGASLTMNYTLY